jgi:fucose 4-O-acetylase-like acetyltransferase
MSFLGRHTLLILILHSPIQAVLVRRLSDAPVAYLLAIFISVAVCFGIALLDMSFVRRNKFMSKVVYG